MLGFILLTFFVVSIKYMQIYFKKKKKSTCKSRGFQKPPITFFAISGAHVKVEWWSSMQFGKVDKNKYMIYTLKQRKKIVSIGY